MSRQALEAIGGLEPLVDYLADDYELGARVSRQGFEVALSGEVVETFLPEYRFAQFLGHQIRWSRSTRFSRKLGYTGVVFTYGLPWAFFNLVASGASLSSIALLSLTLLARVALALAVGVGVLGDRFAIHHTTIQFEHVECEVAHGCVIPVGESEEHHHHSH